jgi:hypothetical protein
MLVPGGSYPLAEVRAGHITVEDEPGFGACRTNTCPPGGRFDWADCNSPGGAKVQESIGRDCGEFGTFPDGAPFAISAPAAVGWETLWRSVGPNISVAYR